jgi:hypothetical protein
MYCRQVLSDVIVEDLQQYLGLSDPPWAAVPAASAGAPAAVAAAAGNAAWDLPAKAQRRLACIAKTVAAVGCLRPQISAVGRACALQCRWEWSAGLVLSDRDHVMFTKVHAA